MWTLIVPWLLACSSQAPTPTPPPPPERQALCVQLIPFEGLRNHLQPFALAVDSERRRAYSASLWNNSMGVFDLDSLEPLAMLPTGTEAPSDPTVAVGAGGDAWLLSSASPALVRFASLASGRALYREPLRQADSAVALDDGSMVVLGTNTEGLQVLQRFDRVGVRGESVALERRGRHLVLTPDRRLALLLQGGGEGGLSFRDPVSLQEMKSCELPFEANYGAVLDDGTTVVSAGERIGLAGCDGKPAEAWTHGIENREVVSIGHAALVLDRTGGEGRDPHKGMAWWVDAGGIHVDRSFATGKHTGHGAWDPVAQRVWLNAKGSSEILVADPEAGQVVERIRTGTYLDGLTLDPLLDDVVYGVGRLSNTVVRVENAEPTAWNHSIFWPFTPVVDTERDLVWVLSQGTSVVYGLDRSDLSIERTLDPGFEPDRWLTFGSIALHPSRKSVFLAHGELDRVLEIDPESGVTVGRWELGGPLIEERKNIGQVWMEVHPDGSLIILRSNDARLQRLDPEAGLEATAWLGEELAAELAVATSMESSRLVSPELVYVGGRAVNAQSLERLPELDLDSALVLGPHPDDGVGMLGVGPESCTLRLFGADGQALRERRFASVTQPSLRYALDEQRRELVLVRAREGRICWFPLSELVSIRDE